MIRKFKTIILTLLFILTTAFILQNFRGSNFWDEISSPKEKIILKEIRQGDTFANLAGEIGLATKTVNAILDSSKNTYDLSALREGRKLAFIFDAAEDTFLKSIAYKIDSENELIINRLEETWESKIQSIPYEIRQKKLSAVINSSLYETFLDNNWDIRLALSLAEIFAWEIDFAADIQKGDSFEIFYEERYLSGQYKMPGKILAAQFKNENKIFKAFYFSGGATKEGYYDESGNSLQKVFLKSPLQYKYISSGFSYNRYNPILKKASPHRGIDYAANADTPAVAVGDGTVVQAGWNGYYGISATVRHNETYTTVYGHFQSLAKEIKIGVRVKQGQVIGYVGSTGLSTGPHLHYEMHKFGNYVNPFKVEVPPGEPISDESRQDFQKTKENFIFSNL